MIQTLSLLLVILTIAAAAYADEVRLKNGDRVAGVTTSLAGGALTFKAAGGELKMPWARRRHWPSPGRRQTDRTFS